MENETEVSANRRPLVRIVGGGVAGLEVAAALADLAPGAAEVSLITPDRDFTYKPLLVEEPFGGPPVPQYELAPLLDQLGTELLEGTLERVEHGAHEVVLAGGETLPYDKLVICVGGVARAAYSDVTTFWSRFAGLDVDDLVERAAAAPGHRISFVVPPGVSWPLPLYEVALMFRRRADELDHRELQIRLMTSEEAPLGVFGRAATEAMAETLAAHRIEVDAGVQVVSDEGVAGMTHVGVPLPRSGPVVALPVIDGPRIPGLPADPHGFLPIDHNCAVRGAADVYAAGDGTTFPVKQGGIATQEADAAAEHIAAALGADVDPSPFRPVLRGRLFARGESLSMRSKITGGGEEGTVSPDYLWWPPDKIAGRYLSKLLGAGEESVDVEAGGRPLEVEVSWPHEWHGEPGMPGPAEPASS